MYVYFCSTRALKTLRVAARAYIKSREQATRLSSATFRLRIFSTATRNGHGRKLFGDRWVNPNRIVQILFRHVHFHRNRVALRHLAGIWAEVMQTNNSLAVRRIHDNFRETRVIFSMHGSVLVRRVVCRPLERFEVRQVRFNVLLAVRLLRQLLGHTDAPVLQRCKYCRRN